MIPGVNLGGWLVLEQWMTPSLFEGSGASDEYSLSKNNRHALELHRKKFITREDFMWLADHDIKLVRLPIGYWVIEADNPYCAASVHIESALAWAQEANIGILLDLHGAPGSQNGEMHSGRIGVPEWHTKTENISRTIGVLKQLAQTYGRHPALWGIELLNEPSREIPLSILFEFYRSAYDVIRQASNHDLKIVINDGYRPIAEFEDMIGDPNYAGMLLDLHLYQHIGAKDRALNFEEHVSKVLKWKQMIEQFGPEKIIIGEWSVALHESYDGMGSDEREYARELYRQAQLYAFSECVAAFYWNYKTESPGDWNFRSQF